MKKNLRKKTKRISSKAFTKFLIDQQPSYDEAIIKDIRPTDSWMQYVLPTPVVTTLRERIKAMEAALKIAQFQWAAYQYCAAFKDKKRRGKMLKRLLAAYKKLHSI